MAVLILRPRLLAAKRKIDAKAQERTARQAFVQAFGHAWRSKVGVGPEVSIATAADHITTVDDDTYHEWIEAKLAAERDDHASSGASSMD